MSDKSKLRDKLARDMFAFDPGKKQYGVTPAVALINPKYPRNVGAVLRACSCFDIHQLWFTGNRVQMNRKQRLPREERMKGYADVELRQYDKVFSQFPANVTPVAIELVEGAESLADFEHPTNALYVFGPEDGGLERVTLQHCHRFVRIPSKHCTNLAAAVYITLYDRVMKRGEGLEIDEYRGFISDFEESLG
jgi:tRNA(Leu) C34 or U34 (ribose-2'-O)-methylase TrmL